MKNFYFVFFFILSVVLQAQQQEIVLDRLHDENEINISQKSVFAYSGSEENIIPGNFTAYSDFEKITPPVQAKVIWQKLRLKSHYQDTLYLFTRQRTAKMELFQLKGNRLVSIGHTGYANRLLNASVKNHFNVIMLPTNEEGEYLLKFSSERYVLNLPETYISPYIYKIQEVEKISMISLIVSGFQFCLFFICIIFITMKWFRDYPRLLVFFTLINITDAVYFLSRYNIIILESQVFTFYTNSQIWNIIGDVNVMLYYVFFAAFFNIPWKSVAGWFVRFGLIFWTIQIFIELSSFTSPAWISFAKFYLNNASVADCMIMLVIVLYIIRFRMEEKFYRIGFIGAFALFLSTLEIALPHILNFSDWTNLPFFSFGMLQMACVVNIFSVVTAIIYDYLEKEKESRKMKLKLVKQEIDKLNLLNRERERISHDMHDDLGAGISAMKLQTEFIRRKINDENVRNDIDELLKTTEDLNLSMREMLWNLNSGNDNLGDLIKYIDRYGEQFFGKTNIIYHKEIGDVRYDNSISADKRRNLFLCIKEAFNNCYKHSGASNVFVGFHQNMKEIIITIKDDGTGIPENSSEGNGMKNMKTRMEASEGFFVIHPVPEGFSLEFRMTL